jgi:integrase/recombinase XerD
MGGKEAVTVEKIISLHLHYLRQSNHRPSTIDSRRKHLNRFFCWLSIHKIEELDRLVLESYLDRHFVSPNHRSSEIDHLTVFFRWCHRENYIVSDPSVGLQRPKRHRGLPRPISDLDLTRAIQLADGDIKAFLCLAAYGGLRACEIAPIKGEDIDWERRILIIREQKGGSTGSIPLNAVLYDCLNKYPAKGYLFRKKDGTDQPLKAHNVARKGNDYLHSLGIDDTFHSLRHWFGTQCYRNSRDLRATQEALRHRSPESTQIYTKIEFDEVRSVVDSLPRIGAA